MFYPLFLCLYFRLQPKFPAACLPIALFNSYVLCTSGDLQSIGSGISPYLSVHKHSTHQVCLNIILRSCKCPQMPRHPLNLSDYFSISWHHTEVSQEILLCKYHLTFSPFWYLYYSTCASIIDKHTPPVDSLLYSGMSVTWN